MALNIEQLMLDITSAASTVVQQDVTQLRGFSQRQVKALAVQANLIAEGVLNGAIDDDLRDYFLDSLEDMALNFAKTLRGLLAVTLEKVWNSIVGVLWGSISKATGITLVTPS